MELLKNKISISLLYLITIPAFANTFNGELGVETGLSDNARKSPDNELDERQDTLQFKVNSDYKNSYLSAAANFSALHQNFAESSQDNRSYINGDSYFKWGDAVDPADLYVGYSRRTLVQQLDQVQITDNLEDRGILDVAPTVRTRFGSRDTLALKAQYSDINYAKSDLRDSTRQGGTLSWQHLISPLSQVQLLAQQTKVEFDAQSQADYTYSNISALYASRLRLLNYSIQFGYNRSKIDGLDDLNGGMFKIDAGFDSGLNKINFSSAKIITDTSLGDANLSNFGYLPGSDGTELIDRIERTSAALDWATEMMCERCTIKLGFSLVKDEYFSLAEEVKQTGVNLGANYRVTRLIGLYFNGQVSRREFSRQVISSDYDIKYFQVGAKYQIVENANVNLMARREERKSDGVGLGYSENYYGVSFSYGF